MENQGSSTSATGSDSSSSRDRTTSRRRSQQDNSWTAKYGFRVVDGNPECVLCRKVLSASSLRADKLKLHLTSKHQEHRDQPEEYFVLKVKEVEGQEGPSNQLSENQKSLLASYLISLRVAQCGQSYTIAEKLVLPSIIDAVTAKLGPEAAEKMKTIPLSDTTVSRRIEEMAKDVTEQICERVKRSEFFALQLDESTDVAGESQFLAFIRYVGKENIEENMLFCKAMPGRTTGECFFNVFKSCTASFDFDWSKCIAICTDGCAAMTGKYSGFVTRFREMVPNAQWNHCFLHRYALVSKGLPEELRAVLKDAVKVVNFIKSKPLNARLFSALCNEMGADHTQLLFHTEVRWLSRGKVLSRLVELQQEIAVFLATQKSNYHGFFDDNAWLGKLCYLADIFSHFNDVNTSMQGAEKNMIGLNCSIKSFLGKIGLWRSKIRKQGNFDCFPALHEFLGKEGNEVHTEAIKNLILEHLEYISNQLTEYFPKVNEQGQFQWILQPFAATSLEKAELPTKLQESLIDLSCNLELEAKFSLTTLSKFWVTLDDCYAAVRSAAIRQLIPFPTSYLCEQGFSHMTIVKDKCRNRLGVETDLIPNINTGVTPNFDKIMTNKQAHPSH